MRKRMVWLLSMIAPMMFATTAFAQEGAGSNDNDMKMFGFLAAALAVGIAALGGTLAQGRAAAAALEGIARNPNASGKLFVPLLLGLALIESLVIFGALISFSILGKLG